MDNATVSATENPAQNVGEDTAENGVQETVSYPHARPEEHIVSQLGLLVSRAGEEMHGSAPVYPEMFVPGTTCLRTSILATWADVLSGHVSIGVLAPRVPVTLDLDVQLHRPPRDLEAVEARARLVKAGKAVLVVRIDFTDGRGEEVAFGTASFMPVPNPAVVLPPEVIDGTAIPRQRGRLTAPFAERARCTVPEPGVATLPRAEDAINASNTINGGLLALTAEEAALSLTPGTTLASLSMRYLRPVRVGPAVATAQVRGALGSVEVRDAGSDNRLGVLAVTRAFEGL